MTAEPFAKVADLEQAWRQLDQTEQARAERLLAAASRKIRLQCPSWRSAETAEPGVCKDICCAMVKRAMLADESNPEGWSQGTRTTGPFTDSWTYANPNGDLYLTGSELDDLNALSTSRMFTVRMTGDDT